MMDERLAPMDDEDLLMERLVQVENALFFLNARSGCADSPDESCEMEKLERMRRELHESYARMYRRPPDRIQDIA